MKIVAMLLLVCAACGPASAMTDRDDTSGDAGSSTLVETWMPVPCAQDTLACPAGDVDDLHACLVYDTAGALTGSCVFVCAWSAATDTDPNTIAQCEAHGGVCEIIVAEPGQPVSVCVPR